MNLDETMTATVRGGVIMSRGDLRLSPPAEQTMGMPATRHHWTTAEVRALIDESPARWPRYELIDGELIVTPAPATIHQIAVSEFLALLIPYGQRVQVGIALTSPSDLELRRGSIVQPDLFVAPLGPPAASDEVLGWSDVTALLLAVEVISPSSVRTDRVDKRDYYMNAQVPAYWVVDLDARVVERWTPERETPLVVRSSLDWRPVGADEALAIDLPALFERIWSKSRRIRTAR